MGERTGRKQEGLALRMSVTVSRQDMGPWDEMEGPERNIKDRMNRHISILMGLGIEVKPTHTPMHLKIKFYHWRQRIDSEFGCPELGDSGFLIDQGSLIVWFDRKEAIERNTEFAERLGRRAHFREERIFFHGENGDKLVGFLHKNSSLILNENEIEAFVSLLCRRLGIDPESDDLKGIGHIGDLFESGNEEYRRAVAIVSAFDKVIDPYDQIKVCGLHFICGATHGKQGRVLTEIVRELDPLLAVVDELEPTSPAYWFRNRDEFDQVCDELFARFPRYSSFEVYGMTYVRVDEGELAFHIQPDIGPVSMKGKQVIRYAKELVKRFGISPDEEEGIVAGSSLLESEEEPNGEPLKSNLRFLRGLGIRSSYIGDGVWIIENLRLKCLRIFREVYLGRKKVYDMRWVDDFRRSGLGGNGLMVVDDITGEFVTVVYMNQEEMSKEIDNWVSQNKAIKREGDSVLELKGGTKIGEIGSDQTWILDSYEIEWIVDRLKKSMHPDEVSGVENIGQILESRVPLFNEWISLR